MRGDLELYVYCSAQSMYMMALWSSGMIPA